jgi:hypothetical protein
VVYVLVNVLKKFKPLMYLLTYFTGRKWIWTEYTTIILESRTYLLFGRTFIPKKNAATARSEFLPASTTNG